MNAIRPLASASLLCFAAASIACGGSSSSPDPRVEKDEKSGDVARSALPRDTSPTVASTDKTAVADANRAFAQDLHRKLFTGDDNGFFSPLSVSYALSMTWAGTRGATSTELGAAIARGVTPETFHPALNALDLELSARGEGKEGKDDEPFRLRIVNSLWGERTTTFEAPFLDLIAKNYGAGVRLTDFVGKPEPARLAINAWVEDATEDRIKDLLAEGSITSDTRLVLVNAVYFNGAWLHPFSAPKTAPAPFQAKAGSVSVPTMHVTANFPHAKGEGYEAIALPYQDPRLQLLAVMPTGDLAAFEAGLDGGKLASIGASLQGTEVELSMPKFKIDGKAISLKPALKALGIETLFDPGAADLDGIQKNGRLFVSDVVHRAFVEVDEKGTEAAAATAVVAGTTSVPPPPVPVKLDRPFLFFLRDVPTDTILFSGRLLDPSKK
jgi:serpin B